MVSDVDQAFRTIVGLLGRSLDFHEVAQAIAEAAVSLPAVDAAAVLRFDMGAELAYIDAGAGVADITELLPSRALLAGEALAARGLRVVEDVAQRPDLVAPTPAAGGRFQAIMVVPLVGDEQPPRALALYRLQPGPFPPGAEGLLTVLAEAACSALRNARAFAGEERRRREQEAINEAALAMSSELSLDRLLQLITTLARDLVGARYAALGVPGPAGTLVQFITTGINPMQRERIGHLPEGLGLLGALLRENTAIRLRRIQDDVRSFGFPPHHPTMRSFLGVPILFRGRNVGDLYLTDKRDAPEFTDDDQRIVERLAGHAAIAIVNAQSYGLTSEQLQEKVAELAAKNRELQRLSQGILAAQEDERRRLARELHDDTMQALAALTVQARLVERSADVNTLRAGIAGLREGIGQTLRELRRLTYDLRPTALDDLGLTAALNGLAQDFGERTGVAVETTIVSPEQRLPAAVEVVLYRIAQEALSNVARHASAGRVRLELSLSPDAIRLGVTDDGHGFSPDRRHRSRESGLGLLGMEERVQALQGRITIASAEGEGTTVTVELPRAREE